VMSCRARIQAGIDPAEKHGQAGFDEVANGAAGSRGNLCSGWSRSLGSCRQCRAGNQPVGAAGRPGGIRLSARPFTYA
jgi:hypothetical protein